MIVTSDYFLSNPKRNEINHSIEKTRLEQERKYGYDCEEIEFEFNIGFVDKRKNKAKKYYK